MKSHWIRNGWRIFFTLCFFHLSNAMAWENHGFGTYATLSSMPEVQKLGKVKVETLDEFLQAVPRWLERFDSDRVTGWTLDNGHRTFSVDRGDSSETSHVLSFEVDRGGALVTVEYMMTE